MAASLAGRITRAVRSWRPKDPMEEVSADEGARVQHGSALRVDFRQSAIAILLAGPAGESGRENRCLARLTGPDGTAALIGQLRAGGTVLTYDPQGRTLRADGHDAPSVTIGKDH